MKNILLTGVVTTLLFYTTIPVQANPFGLNEADLRWCQIEVGNYAKRIESNRHNNSSNYSQSGGGASIGFTIPFEGIPLPFNMGGSHSNQRGQSSSSSSNYYETESDIVTVIDSYR